MAESFVCFVDNNEKIRIFICVDTCISILKTLYIVVRPSEVHVSGINMHALSKTQINVIIYKIFFSYIWQLHERNEMKIITSKTLLLIWITRSWKTQYQWKDSQYKTFCFVVDIGSSSLWNKKKNYTVRMHNLSVL